MSLIDEMQTTNEVITIGDFRIYKDEGLLFINHIGGEGGSFSEEELEKVIDKFFYDNF